jgi:hypothetical protein
VLDTLRVSIYRCLTATGRTPSTGELALELACTVAEIERGLHELAEAHVIVLTPGSTAISMAHPFSGVPTAFRVHSGGVSYWANCAWDALGIAAVLERDTECLASCADCGESMDFSVRGGAPVDCSGLVHLLVPAARFWDDIGYT